MCSCQVFVGGTTHCPVSAIWLGERESPFAVMTGADMFLGANRNWRGN